MRPGCIVSTLSAGVVTIAVFLWFAAGENQVNSALLAPFLAIRSIPAPYNIGTPENPVYEGTPVHLLFGLVGLVINALAFWLVGFVAWRLKRLLKRPQTISQ